MPPRQVPHLLLLYFCDIFQASRVTILQEGPLSKRGKVNTGFKRRWFMLTSAGKMLYFKEDNGQCKGDISTVKIQSVSSTGARDFTVHTPDRTWVFAAESQEVRDVHIHFPRTYRKGWQLTSVVSCFQLPGNGDVGGVHEETLRHKDELAQPVVVRSFISFMLLFCRCCSDCAVRAGFLSVFSPCNAVPVHMPLSLPFLVCCWLPAVDHASSIQKGIFWLRIMYLGSRVSSVLLYALASAPPCRTSLV